MKSYEQLWHTKQMSLLWIAGDFFFSRGYLECVKAISVPPCSGSGKRNKYIMPPKKLRGRGAGLSASVRRQQRNEIVWYGFVVVGINTNTLTVKNLHHGEDKMNNAIYSLPLWLILQVQLRQSQSDMPGLHMLSNKLPTKVQAHVDARM